VNALLAPVLMAVALAVAVRPPRWLRAFQRWLGRALRRPVRPARWAAGLAIAAFVAQVVVALCVGIAKPRVADEFSYLLAGDTFAHGRLANPSHPLPSHFETFYVLLRPTYASVYMPGQGLSLGLGELLGHQALGVWLAGALFVAAASWMLHGWLRPPWARLGSVLVAAMMVVATPWSQSYWGGCVTALAGALVFGATGRLIRRPRFHLGLVLGCGVSLLLLTRPWEGFFATAAAGVLLVASPQRRRAVVMALAAALPLALTVLWLGYYNSRVTGDAKTPPLALYYRLYTVLPAFSWQPERQPEAQLPEVMVPFFRDRFRPDWLGQRTLRGLLGAAVVKTGTLLDFYVGLPLAPALLALPWALRRAGPRRAAFGAGVLLASQLLIMLPTRPHYVAPGAVLATVLMVEGWRELRRWRPGGRRLGAAIAATMPVLVLLAIPLRAVDLRPDPDSWHLRRAALERRLAALPQHQLVIVRYGAAHQAEAEWVSNDADLAGTRVLWARSLSPAEDCALLALEKRRQAWLLEVGEEITPPRLQPYPRAICATTASTRRSTPAAPPPSTAR